MRIAFWHFHTLRLLRGIETLVLSLSSALARRGVDVSIVTAAPRGSPMVTPDPRVKIHAYPAARYFAHWAIVPFYLQHFIRHRYDHVVVFFADFGEGATWRLLRPFQDMPLVLYLCYPASAVPHRYRTFSRLGWGKKAGRLLADSRWIAREAEDLFKRPIQVVPVGTDPERFRPDPGLRARARARWGFKEDDIILLNVAALERRKGAERVIDALDRVREECPRLAYFVLGAGAYEQELRGMVRQRRLEGRVVFGGVSTELEEYYNMADIFIMLPDAEANSIACLEAMSCALPIIASDQGGFLESVPPEAGLLVDPKQPQAVSRAILRLASKPELRQDMGRSGREYVLEHHGWDQVAGKFLEGLG